MDVVKALREHGEAGAAIVDLLYGDAGEEVSKALIEFSKKEKKERDTAKTVAQVSNVVGIGAGAAATPGALTAVRPAMRRAAGKPELPRRTGAARKLVASARGGNKVARGTLKTLKGLRNPKVAGGLAVGGAALQVGNLSGDFVTNQVLARQEAKKDEKQVKKDDGEFEVYTEISKVDTDKRQVFGWASVTSHNGEPVIDLQDDIIPLEEIEKAAYDFVEKSRVGGNMHQKGMKVSDMIESFVVTPEKKEAMGLPPETPEGWWVGFKVHDDQTWEDAKSGKLAGFSVHGTGKREAVA